MENCNDYSCQEDPCDRCKQRLEEIRRFDELYKEKEE